MKTLKVTSVVTFAVTVLAQFSHAQLLPRSRLPKVIIGDPNEVSTSNVELNTYIDLEYVDGGFLKSNGPSEDNMLCLSVCLNIYTLPINLYASVNTQIHK